MCSQEHQSTIDRLGLRVRESLWEATVKSSPGGLVEGPGCWVGTYNVTGTTQAPRQSPVIRPRLKVGDGLLARMTQRQSHRKWAEDGGRKRSLGKE